MKSLHLTLSILFILIVEANVQAKGYPTKIVIQGVDLADPIEITDRDVLSKFSPWYGQFIEWSNGPVAKPNDRPSYEVLFYISVRDPKSPEKAMVSRLIFNFLYSPDPKGGPGLIYLPARTDDKYRVNQAAITRDKDDGRWHQASSLWDGVIRPRLPVKQQPVVIQPVSVSPARSVVPWLMVAVSILGGLAVALKKKFNNLTGSPRLGVRCL